MDKEEYRELRDNEDKTLVNFNPELNQSGYYDNEGNILPKNKREQYDPLPRGFIDSGLWYKLTARDKDIYFFLSSKCNNWRNTKKTNPYITRETGIPDITVKRSLRRLEFYHFICKRPYSMGPKSKRRVITLLRWDNAYKLLIKEGKIKATSSKEILFITPYLPDKFKKSDRF
jgi:hypothetical protein